jgi:hypothetical protein
MNDIQATALARLRAADPVGAPSDSRGPSAHDMLERVLAAAEAPARNRARPLRRWVAAGTVGAAATVSTVLAVTTPWSRGQAASAYTVVRLPNGTVNVTIALRQLDDPAQLNAELRRENAQTVALRMLPANQCSISPSITAPFADPDPNPADQAALRQAVSLATRPAMAFLTINPQKIPANETLVVAYAVYQLPQGQAERIILRIVPSVPPCLPAPSPPELPAYTPRR